MNPQTVQRLLQLLVSGPLMIQHSSKQKNKYFKIALGAGGTALVMMALYDILKDRQTVKLEEQKKAQQDLQKLLTILK